jgi:hypothetical protein
MQTGMVEIFCRLTIDGPAAAVGKTLALSPRSFMLMKVRLVWKSGVLRERGLFDTDLDRITVGGRVEWHAVQGIGLSPISARPPSSLATELRHRGRKSRCPGPGSPAYSRWRCSTPGRGSVPPAGGVRRRARRSFLEIDSHCFSCEIGRLAWRAAHVEWPPASAEDACRRVDRSELQSKGIAHVQHKNFTPDRLDFVARRNDESFVGRAGDAGAACRASAASARVWN